VDATNPAPVATKGGVVTYQVEEKAKVAVEETVKEKATETVKETAEEAVEEAFEQTVGKIFEVADPTLGPFIVFGT
jgi:nicotinamide mononucleotide (NMN) deamidase PncC